MKSLLIHGGEIYTPDRVIHDGWILVRDQVIAALGSGTCTEEADQRVDATDHFIVPGFIDIHTHGGDGADFSDGTLEAFEKATLFHARHGVTALQATTTTIPLDELRQVFETARVWATRQAGAGSQVVGIHVEGPFINVQQRGCQPSRNCLVPTPKHTEFLLEYRDVITEVTLAPELPAALSMIAQLTQAGILVSAGHSNAFGEEVTAGIDAGIRHITHIYSAMSSMKREGPYRIPGLLEIALTDPRVTVEMIADGKHLPPTFMRLVWQCKGADMLCSVSDSMRGAGLPEGQRLAIAGEEAIIQDGVAIMVDFTGFAGSITPLDQMLPILMRDLGQPLMNILPLLTRIPARILGIEQRKGRIAVGMDADLAMLDRDLNVQTTLIGGQVAFREGASVR